MTSSSLAIFCSLLKCLVLSFFPTVIRFGVGYHMTVVKESSKCEKGNLTAFIGERVPGSRLVSDAGAEIAYVLPREETKFFANLFSDLEGMY